MSKNIEIKNAKKREYKEEKENQWGKFSLRNVQQCVFCRITELYELVWSVPKLLGSALLASIRKLYIFHMVLFLLFFQKNNTNVQFSGSHMLSLCISGIYG